jgi:hypothetical protein
MANGCEGSAAENAIGWVILFQIRYQLAELYILLPQAASSIIDPGLSWRYFRPQRTGERVYARRAAFGTTKRAVTGVTCAKRLEVTLWKVQIDSAD